MTKVTEVAEASRKEMAEVAEANHKEGEEVVEVTEPRTLSLISLSLEGRGLG